MVEECRALLLTVSLQVDILDAWSWVPYPVVGYSVSGAYRILTNPNSTHDFVPPDLLWLKDVPLKLSVLAWRLFRNRLST